jgi:hypothetical protein
MLCWVYKYKLQLFLDSSEWSAGKEIPLLLSKPKIHLSDHKSPTIVNILR